MQYRANPDIECLAQAGSQRSGNSQIGEWSNRNWPGAIFGIRPPFPKEIPLSWEEVHFAVSRGIK